MCSLDQTLLDFALLYFVLQGQIRLLLQVSLDFLLCIPVSGSGVGLQWPAAGSEALIGAACAPNLL